MLRIYDTAERRLVDFEPREPGKVSMYVCGPTVYDVPHLGHGRFAIVWDVVRRYLEWSGFEVRFVSNITDIEDKIINRANEEGRSAEEVVSEYTESWHEAMRRLGVRAPDEEPYATGYVEQMVDYIAELVDRGRAYVTPDGVNFSVEALEDYGLLAHQPLDSLRSGGGLRDIVGEEHKRSPLDFALWKAAKPGEPSWDSPWQPGRPGWHIECTVMSLHLLGEGFDLHGGGDDLRFPHHENERAQAVGGARRFARYWVHNGMVTARGGEKMSKSAGNYVSLPELLGREDPRAFRLLVLRSHYRSPMEVSSEALADATEAVRRLDNFTRRTATLVAGDGTSASSVLSEFRAAMDDDFNTPPAVAAMFDAVRRANGLLDEGNAAAARPLAHAVREMAAVFGLELRGPSEDVDAESLAMAAERDSARASKNWARADELRAALEERGWIVEDTPQGTRLTRRSG